MLMRALRYVVSTTLVLTSLLLVVVACAAALAGKRIMELAVYIDPEHWGRGR